MSRQPESVIKNAILQWLNAQRGVWAWSNYNGGIFDPTRKTWRRHSSKFSINGMPDILGVISRPGNRGTLIAIEVKTPTGKVSKDQKFALERLRNHQAIAFVARSVDDVVTALAPVLAVSAVLSGGERRVKCCQCADGDPDA